MVVVVVIIIMLLLLWGGKLAGVKGEGALCPSYFTDGLRDGRRGLQR